MNKEAVGTDLSQVPPRCQTLSSYGDLIKCPTTSARPAPQFTKEATAAQGVIKVPGVKGGRFAILPDSKSLQEGGVLPCTALPVVSCAGHGTPQSSSISSDLLSNSTPLSLIHTAS